MKQLRAVVCAFLLSSCAEAPAQSGPPVAPNVAPPPGAPAIAAAGAVAEPVGVPMAGKASCEDEGTEQAVDPDTIDSIAPEQPAPSFDVTTLDCRKVDSRDLLGKRAFVLVFFASWCHVCERKMPIIRDASRALRKDVPFLGVALDENETWGDVSGFVARHEIAFPIVRGARFKKFALTYDPVGSIPVVVIVGKDGVPVDMQVGYSPFDYNRLLGAVQLAKDPSSDVRSMPAPLEPTPAVFPM